MTGAAYLWRIICVPSARRQVRSKEGREKLRYGEGAFKELPVLYVCISQPVALQQKAVTLLQSCASELHIESNWELCSSLGATRNIYFLNGSVCKIKELSLLSSGNCDGRCAGFGFGRQYASKWHQQPVSVLQRAGARPAESCCCDWHLL